MEERQLFDLLESARKEPDYISYGISSDSSKELAPYIPDLETAHALIKEQVLPRGIDYITKIAPSVQQFIKLLISNRSVQKILDPWANIGELIYLAGEVYPEAEKVGYLSNHSLFLFNNIVKARFEQRHIDTLHLIGEDSTKYDLILSNLPMGRVAFFDEQESDIKDVDLQIILNALTALRENGVLIVVVSPFFFKTSKPKFIDFLVASGYAIKALFGVPVGSILAVDIFSGSKYLLVIEKGTQKEVFLAEVDENFERQKRIFNNYQQFKRAKDIKEGFLLPAQEIQPLPKIISKNEVDILLKRTGLPLMSLNQLGCFKKADQIESNGLVFYNMPSKKIELWVSSEEDNKKAKYLFEVNTQLVGTKYLLELLNSNLGNKILNAAATGPSSMLQFLSRNSLNNIVLPIPPIELQQEVIEIDRNIRNHEELFKTLRANLWKNPNKKNEVQKALKQKLKSPDGNEWVEELPFPLASILWGYFSKSKLEKKVEYLFLFFEGLCEFLDTLLLSGLISNQSFFDLTAKEWLKNEEMPGWYVKSSFGGWHYLLQKLAKNVRTIYNEPKEKQFTIELFGGASEDFFKLITSKTILSILREVIDIRNNKAHGGITSEKVWKDRLNLLESKLYLIKDELVEGFSTVNLISPLPNLMGWDEDIGIYTTTCKLLKGTRSEFNEIPVQTQRPISHKKLYLLHENQFTPIEILPIVQMRETDTQDYACFFYNRIEGDQIRLVSYHFDKEQELFDKKASMSQVFDILKPTE